MTDEKEVKVEPGSGTLLGDREKKALIRQMVKNRFLTKQQATEVMPGWDEPDQ